MAEKHDAPARRSNFHEAYAPGEVKPPPPKSTGLVFTAIAIIVAVIFRNSLTILIISGCIAALLASLSFAAPHLLQPLNMLWFKFGMLLHRIVNPVVMFLMFAIAFVPMGLLMRLFHDPLKLKRKEGQKSYWLEPDPAEVKLSSMKNQF
jgi:hypothetical protein